MNNYLFEDLENGGYFFVECEDETEIDEILLHNDIDPESVVRCPGVYTCIEAEILGYDTY